MLVCSSFVRLSCPHLHRSHALQTFNPGRALKVFSLNVRSLPARFAAARFAAARFAGRRLPGIWHCCQKYTAAGAIHAVCSLRTQPQSAAPLAILQFDLDFLAFHPAYEVHDCLSPYEMKNIQTKKSPGTDFSAQGSFLLR
jgi:hypothetical protein